MKEEKRTAFETSGERKESSLLGEFFAMLKENKKWWLIPIVIALLIFGLMIIFGGASPLAPFIYTLF